MLVKRNFYNEKGEQLGTYLVDIENEIFVYDVDGNKIDYSQESPEMQNFIDDWIDTFEEEANNVEDGYEVMGHIGQTTITLKRKIEKVEYLK